MARLTGWRYSVFIGCFVGLVGLQSYFTMISPMLNPEPYKQIQDEINKKYPDWKRKT